MLARTLRLHAVKVVATRLAVSVGLVVHHAILAPYAVYLYLYTYRCGCTYRVTRLRVVS